ncbi:hypothetical protein [Scytonema sp. NUACC21]
MSSEQLTVRKTDTNLRYLRDLGEIPPTQRLLSLLLEIDRLYKFG